jgi:hypothetical protein
VCVRYDAVNRGFVCRLLAPTELFFWHMYLCNRLTYPNSSCIHSYLFLRALPNITTRTCTHCNQPRPCPNCKHTVPPPDAPRWSSSRNHDFPLRSPVSGRFESVTNGRLERSHGGDNSSIQKLYQPFMANYRAEAAAARESSDFHTSGHNTPRRSAETLDGEIVEISGGVGIDERGFGSLV